MARPAERDVYGTSAPYAIGAGLNEPFYCRYCVLRGRMALSRAVSGRMGAEYAVRYGNPFYLTDVACGVTPECLSVRTPYPLTKG